MTQEEFDSTKFTVGIPITHIIDGKGVIVGVDPGERLFQVQYPQFIGEYWVRCENVELIT